MATAEGSQLGAAMAWPKTYETNIGGLAKDGKVVIAGDAVFKYHDTYGLPWESIFSELKRRNCYFDVAGLCLKLAASYGWGIDRCCRELHFAVKDTYGPEMAACLKRLLTRKKKAVLELDLDVS